MLGSKAKDAAQWTERHRAAPTTKRSLKHSVLKEGKYGLLFQMKNKKGGKGVCAKTIWRIFYK